MAKIIYGMQSIESFMEVVTSKADLFDLRSAYDFPLRRRNDPKTGASVPSLDMAEFKAWCKENGVDPKTPEAITAAVLDRNHVQRALQQMPPVRLVGYSQICAFCRRRPVELTNLQGYVGYPVRKEGREWVCDGRELLEFLHKHNYEIPMYEVFRKRSVA